MTGVPVGALVALGLVALLVALALRAGGAAVQAIHRTALATLESSTLPSAARIVRLASDPRRVASAAAGAAVVCEVLATVCVTLLLDVAGLRWWAVLLLAVLLLGIAVVVVRGAAVVLGERHPVGTLVTTSGLLLAVRFLVSAVRPVGRSTDEHEDDLSEEIRDMVERVSEADHIEEEDREMFRSVLELGDTITRAVMVPRTAMVTVPRGTPMRKALTLFLRSGFSRIPVVGESVDDLVGVVYLKDVVRRRHGAERDDDEPVEVVARPPVFVPESKPVDELLREMQHGSAHIALVVDEFGGIAGLVTMEDALEEIVGELTDEHDPVGPEAEDLGDGAYRVPSQMSVGELGELFDLELEDDDVDTVGGLLAKVLGKVPLAGSSGEVGGLLLTADRVEGRRKQLATVVVRRTEHDADPATLDTSSSQGVHR